MTSYIELNNVTLDIPIFDTSRSFRETFKNKWIGGQIKKQGKSKRTSIRALENINFRLNKGDRLGLVGHNGAGKTTLLRLLARVYHPTSGRLITQGNITPLFNISIGLDPDDSGVDNIFTIGTYLGMSKEDINAKKEDIIAFSELGDFIHLPVRTYSTGMSVRLSFAIATALDPDILLMDEEIGTSDANFAEKAKRRLEAFYSKLSILVIASHSEEIIRRMCNKALLLKHGRPTAFGNVDEVLEQYNKSPT